LTNTDTHGLKTNPCRATDEAYDTRRCYDAIADRGAAAVMPRHRN
jgi:hypothetical protein